MPINRRKLREFSATLQQFRDVHGDMPIQQLQTLLTVALNNGETQRSIRDLSHQTRASNSRNLQAWSRRTRHKRPGPGYLVLHEDPNDLRYKTVHLTAKGEAFLASIFDASGGPAA